MADLDSSLSIILCCSIDFENSIGESDGWMV